MAIHQAKNDNEVVEMLKVPLRTAVDHVVQMIWSENRAQINSFIYNRNVPSEYQRTGEFKEAWKTEAKIKSGSSTNIVEGTFEYDPSKITTVDAPYHASVVDGSSAAEYLAEIIYQGIAGDIFGEGFWTQPRDAFEALLKAIGKQKMKRYISEGLHIAGLDFTQHSTALQVDYE